MSARALTEWISASIVEAETTRLLNAGSIVAAWIVGAKNTAPEAGGAQNT